MKLFSLLCLATAASAKRGKKKKPSIVDDERRVNVNDAREKECNVEASSFSSSGNGGTEGSFTLSDYQNNLQCHFDIVASDSCDELELTAGAVAIEKSRGCVYDSFRFEWTANGASEDTLSDPNCGCIGDGCSHALFSGTGTEDDAYSPLINGLTVNSNRVKFMFGSDYSVRDGHMTINWRCLNTFSWSDWSGWGDCSHDCGGGSATRTRVCQNDQNGSEVSDDNCSGVASDTQSCNTQSCFDWSAWSDWGKCTEQCGGGSSTRTRTCVDDEGNTGNGTECEGDALESETCNTESCYDWSAWSDWGKCTEQCGGGSSTRTRSCVDNEGNSGKGGECEGDSSESETCNTEVCFEWTAWSDWGKCSEQCGGGSQSRNRGCINHNGSKTNPDNCPDGDTTEKSSCNTEECPEWSDWSTWLACTKSCGGGATSRSRICMRGDQTVDNDECEGDNGETDTCNTEECNDCEFHEWEGKYVSAWWNYFWEEPVNSIEECRAICGGMEDCKAYLFFHYKYTNNDYEYNYCYFNTYGQFYATYDYDYEYTWATYKATFGLRTDFDRTVDGASGLPDVDETSTVPCGSLAGDCLSTDTGFGSVNYMNTAGEVNMPASFPFNNYVATDDETDDCKGTCFETAGCTSYYTNGTCNMIIGRTQPCYDYYNWYTCPDVDEVTESGRFSYFCPNKDVFTTSFTKKSRFYCKFLTSTQEEDLVQQLIDENDIDSSTPMGRWVFETVSTDPLSKTSQFVDVSSRNPYGDNTEDEAAWTWVQFILETHTRTAVEQDRGLRTPHRFVDVEEMTAWMEAQNKKANKKRNRQRRQALDALDALDASFIDAIFTDLNLPEGAEVTETTEVEVTELSQVTADGEVAADCSSGTCECSEGYEDFGEGDGCELIPIWGEWQDNACSASCDAGTMTRTRVCGDGTRPNACDGDAAETAVCNRGACDGSDKTPEQLMNDVNQAVKDILDGAEFSRAGTAERLKNPWSKLIDKFTKKYKKIKNKDKECTDFPEPDRDQFKVTADGYCDQIDEVTDAILYFGETFTEDCSKASKGLNKSFNKRVSQKVRNLSERTSRILKRSPNNNC